MKLKFPWPNSRADAKLFPTANPPDVPVKAGNVVKDAVSVLLKIPLVYSLCVPESKV